MSPANVLSSIDLAMRRHADRPAQRIRRNGAWEAWNYGQLHERWVRLAAAFHKLGIRPGDRVGIWCPNRPEWTQADLALLRLRALPVPLYTSCTAEQAAEILRDSGAGWLLAGGERQIGLARELRADLGLKGLVWLEDAVALAGETTLPDLLEKSPDPLDSAAVEAGLALLGPEDPLTLIYTSGTTGEPKGVLLSHANLLHQCATVDRYFTLDEQDSSLSFLPLSHVFERAWTYYLLTRGTEIISVEQMAQVPEALRQVRPSTLVSVPRLFEKIRQAVLDKVAQAPSLRRRLFAFALKAGLEAGRRRLEGRRLPLLLALRHALAERLALRRLREAVGGPKKLLVCGGASLDREVEDFFLAAGLPICQGYGLTETSPIVCCNRPGEFRPGSVGRPVAGCELCLNPETGEVLVRGDNVFQGYWNRPAETALAFDGDWFRTGDVGVLDADGYLSITDRIKDLIVTSQGKNIAPQRIEGLLARDAYIEQAAAVGEGRKCVTALIVPVFERIEAFAREHGLVWENREHLLKLPEVLDLLKRRIEEQSRELARHETVRRFTLLPELFSEAAGEITPTLKLRREVIQTRYRELIDAMYKALDEAVEPFTRHPQRSDG